MSETSKLKSISFSEKSDAEQVLETLKETIKGWELTSVADFYELSGERMSYTDSRWGWTNLDSASVKEHHLGWTVELPDPVEFA